nr:MAG TPA: hypothetical protein [Caudoviricetes sp.]
MDTTCLISLLLSSWENGIESRAWIERLLCFLLAVVLFLYLNVKYYTIQENIL